uniref:Uncharacterized protein n=1 Tax=Anguilla anguilla TaxID=7936 RepID=A0A0E9TRK4_ANGAN
MLCDFCKDPHLPETLCPFQNNFILRLPCLLKSAGSRWREFATESSAVDL